MNNNRGNNRRRGRGGNRQQGGQQVNRIDSRARGNAPQLLEKYKKLAHDAHLNGDRVQEEYYLQFADHYFRVLADQRQRQEEGRQPRRDDRPHDYADYAASDDETDGEGARSYQGSYQGSYQDREPAGDRAPQGNGETRSEPAEAGDDSASEGERSIYEPVENPFVRDGRNTRGGLKQRRPRRDRDEGRDEEPNGNVAPRTDEVASMQEAASGFDLAALPPAISAKADEKPKRRTRAKGPADEGEEAAEKPRPRRRTRKADSPADEAGGSPLETID